MGDVTTTPTITFGRWSGYAINKVPVSYLRWMIGNRTPLHEEARVELVRRGSVLPTMDISGHAIDRASQRCLKLWRRTRHRDEGLHAWIVRQAREAFFKMKEDTDFALHIGHRWYFEMDGEWPVLVTISDRKN